MSYQVSENFLNDEEQTKVQLASLGQEMKTFHSELQEHRINALKNSRQPKPNQKGREIATRVCNQCRTNGHTPSWCRKKIRDEGTKRIQKEMVAEKRVTFWNGYNKHRRNSLGSGQFKYEHTGSRNQVTWEMADLQQSTYEGATQLKLRNTWGNPAKNNSFNSGRGRSFQRYQNQFANRNDNNYHSNGSTGNPTNGTWQIFGINPRSASGSRRDAQPSRLY